MPSFAVQMFVRRGAVVIAAILATIAASVPTPALAVDGRTAVALCIDSSAGGARCAWSVNDKGEIDICNKSGCVYCPSAQGQCVAAKGRTRPTRTMPVGTKVITPFHLVEVSKEPFTGSIMGAFCPENLVRCKNRCIPRNQECIMEK